MRRLNRSFLIAAVLWESLGFVSYAFSQELITDADAVHPVTIQSVVDAEAARAEELKAFRLDPPKLITGEPEERESLFSLKYEKSLKKLAGPSYISLGQASMEARVLSVPVYSNVYLSQRPNRLFLSAGMGVLDLKAAGGGIEFNGRSQLLIRFSAHAAYSDRFYPTAGVRIGRSF